MVLPKAITFTKSRLDPVFISEVYFSFFSRVLSLPSLVPAICCPTFPPSEGSEKCPLIIRGKISITQSQCYKALYSRQQTFNSAKARLGYPCLLFWISLVVRMTNSCQQHLLPKSCFSLSLSSWRLYRSWSVGYIPVS